MLSLGVYGVILGGFASHNNYSIIVAKSARLDETNSQSVLVTVSFDREQLDGLRPGASVTAKIDCGHRSLGYVWLHELFEFVQSRILFRL